MNEHEQQCIIHVNMQHKYVKRNARVARSIRRARAVVSTWSYEQLTTWLDKANGRHFTMWYKYRSMVEEALLYRHP